ncbi:hypothetical protein EX227_12630 [Providencia rettgeri]|uniref:Uncharacterized protein n=1 Tax=Providencia rettgeri TaxID=587 RepID=A0AAP2K1J4_PRORE|nr:hypothetical protein [Providencia rettgeri]MBX6957937.1 hypothetical protein [Providencia rettgeri]MBX6973295.1 hypothetical protein [Providencia rettgeri]MBX6982603.1 hypothetical protein [Providencia rettgeri]MBX6991843.1 hypothetical protein [Providencia rettgeri]
MDHGHDYRALPHYTARQLTLFYEEVQKQQLIERQNRTQDIGVGFSGGKSLSAYLNRFKQLLMPR